MEKQSELIEFLDKLELFLAKALTKKAVKDVLQRPPEKISSTPHNKTQSSDVIGEDWGDQPFN
jgi:hypothetical protein